jgi:spore coat-associated protein N
MRAGPTRRKTLGTLGVLAALLVGAATLQAAIGSERATTAPLALTSANGSMSLSNSKDGAAIFTLANIGPGNSGDGEVTVSNSGDAPGSLALSSLEPSDLPGRYGGLLSERLLLRLEDVGSGAALVLYSGQLAAMPELPLGTLAVGESRTYRFVVAMIDGGPPASPYTDDNVYQRASAGIGYEWTLTEVEGGGPEPEEPTLPPPPAPPTLPESASPITPAPVEPIQPPSPSSAFRLGNLKLDKKSGSAALTLVLPGPGWLVLEGKGIVRRTKTVQKEGKVVLAIKPTKKTQRELKKTGRAKVTVTITFTPTGGTPHTESKRLTLKR